MHFSLPSRLAAAALASTAWSHGIITISAPRAVGAASSAACGSGVTNLIKTDNTSHVKGLPEAAATNSAYNAAECNLWLCKGPQLADNKADAQKFTTGVSGYADLDSNSAYRNGERERGGYENESGDWGPLD